jgi:L-asparaginase
VSSEQFEAFESANYPYLGESGVHLNFNEQWLHKADSGLSLKLEKNLNANVVILKLFPGINRSMVEHILNFKELEGVILETFGAGNAPTDRWFSDLLKKTIDREIPIINVTQCTSGGVLMGHYETSMQLKAAGVISGKNITTESAIAKLKLLLGRKVPFQDFKLKFETSIRGEMD